MTAKGSWQQLSTPEQAALSEFARRLKEQFDGAIPCAVLFGSRASGESRQDTTLYRNIRRDAVPMPGFS